MARSWHAGKEAAIQAADALVLLLTAAAADSVAVTYEWALALGSGVPVFALVDGAENEHPRLQLAHRYERAAFGDENHFWDHFVSDFKQQIVAERQAAPPAPSAAADIDKSVMPEAPGYWLVMRRGPLLNQLFRLEREVVNIGRDLANDIVIRDAQVSRYHVSLTLEGQDYCVDDLRQQQRHTRQRRADQRPRRPERRRHYRFGRCDCLDLRPGISGLERQLADDDCRIAGYDRARRHIAAHDAARAHHRARPNRHTFQNQRIHADKDILAYAYRRGPGVKRGFDSPLRRQRMKVAIGNHGIGADPNAIADADALIADQRAAGHAEVVADAQPGAGAARAEDDRVVGAERIAARGRAQVQALTNADRALPMPLNDGQAVTAPAAADRHAAQRPPGARQQQQRRRNSLPAFPGAWRAPGAATRAIAARRDFRQ